MLDYMILLHLNDRIKAAKFEYIVYYEKCYKVYCYFITISQSYCGSVIPRLLDALVIAVSNVNS